MHSSSFSDSPELSQWYAQTFTDELDLLVSNSNTPRTQNATAALLQRMAAVDAVTELLDGLSTFGKSVWQSDKDVDECPLCHQSFSLFNRRHHCRVCFQIRCDACAPNAPPRICKVCKKRLHFVDLIKKVRVMERLAVISPTRHNIFAGTLQTLFSRLVTFFF